MKRLSAIAFALTLALGAGGCVDNHASVQIYAICGPPEDAAKCTTAGECETVLAGRPQVVTRYFDDGTTVIYNSLDLYVQVNNRMPDNSDESAGRVNTNDAIVENLRFAFQVTGYTVGGIPGVLPVVSLTYPFAQTVPTNSSTTPMIPLIPAEIMGAAPFTPLGTGLNGVAAGDDDKYLVVLVELSLEGHLEDGTHFETAAHTMAVEVYDGVAALPICPKAPAEIVTAICPHAGQTASFVCEAP